MNESPDTGFELGAIAVRGRARYLSITEAPKNTDYLRVNGKVIFLSLNPECQSGGRA